jgi:hypothetical protein
MPRIQGKRIIVITLEEFEAECCLLGWCRPADVSDLKAQGK